MIERWFIRFGPRTSFVCLDLVYELLMINASLFCLLLQIEKACSGEGLPISIDLCFVFYVLVSFATFEFGSSGSPTSLVRSRQVSFEHMVGSEIFGLQCLLLSFSFSFSLTFFHLCLFMHFKVFSAASIHRHLLPYSPISSLLNPQSAPMARQSTTRREVRKASTWLKRIKIN